MLNKRSFNAKTLADISRALFGKFCVSVFAEEGTTPSPDVSNQSVPDSSSPINYEQLIAAARKEEKDKLYPRLKKAEDDLKANVQTINTLLLEKAALSEEVARLKEQQSNQKPDPRIAELEADKVKLEEEIKTLKESAPNEDEIRKRIEQEYEVKLYAQKQIEENKGKILTMLVDSIVGTTKEEIDDAVTKAIEQTKSVRKDLGLDEDDSTPEKDEQPSKRKPGRPPKANPQSGGTGTDTYTAEYIQSLDPRSEEYKEFRKKLGLK